MDVQNKTILVPGGASGLGAACVRLLTQAGARAVIVDLNNEMGNALAQELSGSAIFVKPNVIDETEVQAAVKAAVEKFGGLHVAINCAGIGVAEKVVGKEITHSLASFTRVINDKLISTYNVIRLAA